MYIYVYIYKERAREKEIERGSTLNPPSVSSSRARHITSAMENTLLPDEALLQTVAVNSPLRSTIIPAHLRFIEWCAPFPAVSL